MSFYDAVSDKILPVKPAEYDFYENWPSFLVVVYMVLILLCGIIYTTLLEFEKKRNIMEDEDNKDEKETYDDESSLEYGRGNSFTITSFAMYRNVLLMPFANPYRFFKLLVINMIFIHPVLALKYKFDPSIPKVYKFSFLFSQLTILLALCFFNFHEEPNLED